MPVCIIDATSILIVVVVWWDTAKTLSQAGIYGAWPRCVILVVVVPSIIVAPILLAVSFCISLRTGDVRLVLAATAIAGYLYRLGLFTRAAVASAPVETKNQDTGEEV